MPHAIVRRHIQRSRRHTTPSFANIKFSVELKVLEVNVVAEEWAFASTTSAGTTVVHGQENHESNHELFVIQKVKGI